MVSHVHDWLELLFRWAHLITGVAWIGASFYFNWLENHLERSASGNREGIAGHLWAIHGGGFYYLEKYRVAPDSLPPELHWFKWEAYMTWVTGVALLVLVYYLGAESYLIDPRVAELSPAVAIGIGVGALVVSWLVYDGLCRSPLGGRPGVLSAVIAVLLVVLSFGLTQVFGGRGAFIHVGAAIGTIMVANVFFVIIPNQRDLVAAVRHGRDPDPAKGQAGLTRSRHNNYFTLPVLFVMISSHYPNTYAHAWNWVVLALIMAGGVAVRHYFNVRHLPGRKVWILPVGAAFLLAAFLITMPRSGDQAASEDADTSPVTTEAAWAIVENRCLACHAADAGQGGIRFTDPADLERQASAVARVVRSGQMPPGNATGITDEERRRLVRWFEQMDE
ncbi:MAG: urate hydroxylase PuuD [Ectothiorhodospiraceae bacterium]